MIVGIVGGGQLARMLALAGIPLGLRFVFLDPAEDACATTLGNTSAAPTTTKPCWPAWRTSAMW